MKKNLFILVSLLPMLVLGEGVASTDTFPSKAINVWVGYGAGSGTDVSMRAIANIASKGLKQPIVVSNVTGGGGSLVLGRLKGENPDGYTLACTASGVLSRTPHQQPVPYNATEPLKDFIPLLSYSRYIHGLAVRSDSPWKTLAEFVAYARANPGKIRYSTSGAGTGQHLIMEYLGMKEKIKWTHVPFTASPQAVAAVLGGHVEAVAQTPEWKEQVDAGNMRLLACLNDKRMPFYPNVPTLKEKGYGETAVRTLIVIYALANTPGKVVETLTQAFREAADRDEVKQILNQLNYTFELMDRAELVSLIKEDYEVNGKILKELGLGIYKK